MLFAAGYGRRMGRLTADRPKPLVPVAGRPLIDHALALAAEAGVTRRAANVHYRPEPLARHLEARGVAVSREDPILDTGGGLRAALPLLFPGPSAGTGPNANAGPNAGGGGRGGGGDRPAGPVLTLNTDAVWRGPNPLEALIEGWAAAPPETEALLLCVPLAGALGRGAPGDFALAEGGRLSRGGPLVYTGAQVIDPRALADVPDPVFSLNRVWDAVAARSALRGLVWSGAWCDVGRPEGVALAEAMLAQEVP